MADDPRHLSIPSTHASLLTLLSSGRTNEDIQSELVEIMGFEGDGLSLVEDLLKPGARELVLKNGGKVSVLPIPCES
jgi:antiviral helicase SLH1